eukprot:5156478-Pyramimonas_sp.AAC.1
MDRGLLRYAPWEANAHAFWRPRPLKGTGYFFAPRADVSRLRSCSERCSRRTSIPRTRARFLATFAPPPRPLA